MKSAFANWGIVWLLCSQLFVAETAVLEKDFLIARFTAEDGLPANSVHGIEQTPDGYLWISTYNGLARFDGVKFTVFNKANTPELSASGLVQLHADSTGRLWIVDDAWHLTMWDGERFRRFSGTELPDGQIGIEGESPEGKLLVRVLGKEQYFLFDRTTFVDWHWIDELEGGFIGIQSDRRARLWSRRHGVWEGRTDGFFSKYLQPKGELVRACRPCRSGGTWVAGNKGVHHFSDSEPTRSFPSPGEISDATAMIEDRDGAVWIGTWTQGLWRMDSNGNFTRYPVTRGAKAEAVRALLEDSEGNIWVGAEGSGLFRLRRKLFDTLDVESGLAGEVIRSVTRDSKDVIWAINQGGLDRIETKGGKPAITHVTDIDVAWTVFADSRDRVWVGTYGGQLCSFEAGATRRYVPSCTNKTAAITTLFEHDDALLVGTIDGLWELRKGQLSKRAIAEIPGRFIVRALTKGSRGELFMGVGGSGLWRFENGQWSRVNAEKFSEDQIRAVHCDADGTLWIASFERGLYRIKDNRAFHFESGLSNLPRQIGSIIEDRNDNLWLSSMQGIATVSRESLNRFADGTAATLTPIRYTKNDGLRTVEASMGHQPLSCATSDGRLWFGMVKGLSVVDPNSLSRNSIAPLVVIEEAQVFAKQKSPERPDPPATTARPKASAPIILPPGAQRLELNYTALNFSAPERVRFRYRLDGQDWTEAGSRRTAYFQGLAPGDYTFRVIACNNDGVWNENGAVATIKVLPRFTQTAWFRALLVLALGGAGLIAYRARVSQLKAVNDLRLRIARDLHDEIGANLGSIGLNTELLMNDAEISPAQRQDLAEIRGVTSQTAQSVRDIVWFTNPNFDNTTGMLRRMREVATLSLAGRKWNLEISNDPGTPLPLEFRRNVFSIFKESLHNLVKHSGATEANVAIRFHKDEMEMFISDNGNGFDAAGVSGNGILNLRRRAEEIGGRLEIKTKPNVGTRIEFCAPLKRRGLFQKWFPRTRD